MNETFEQAQLTQILYEISMSIGTSVELRTMLKTSLSTILKKLNCVSGGVYQIEQRRHHGDCQFQAAYTIPRHPERNTTYQEALSMLPNTVTEAEANTFLATLPLVGQSEAGNFYHILDLPAFGLLILIKNEEALAEPLLKSLTQLLAKLATAAIACVNEGKLRQSEERYRMFTNATFDGIMVHDGPIVTEINPALAETISYTPEELIGTNIFDFLDPSCHELARTNASKLVDSPYELLAVRKDGTRLPIEVTDKEYTEDGKTYRVTAVRNLSHQKQLETELQSLVEHRTRQVQISTQVAQAIAAATDLNDLYHRIVTEVKEQFGYYHTQLLRYNKETDTVQLIAGYGDIGKQMYTDNHHLPMGKGLIGTAAATGQSVLRHDLANDPDWTPNPLLPDTKSEIAVPIKLGEEILGVLDVQSNITGAITSSDQLLLEGLCGQIAVAINATYLTTERVKAEKALQKSQEALQGTLEREQILHDVSLELSSIQDLDELYQQIILKARERLGFDRIGLFLVNIDEEILSGTYGISPDGELISIKHDVFNFSDGNWVKKLVYSQERIFVKENTDLLEGQEVIGRGWHLTASMKIRGTLIGIIFADNLVSQQPFQPHLPELLSAYSTDAANLIDRLRAYKALHQSEQILQEVLDQQKALLTVSQNLTSINDPDELYKQVILQAQEHLGFERLGLYLLDIDNGTTRGTYGIDPQGKLRSEKDNSFSFKNEPWVNGFIYNTERSIGKEDEDLYERDEVIGHGWNLIAAIWQEDKPMGVLFADNLLSQAPLLPSQPDILTAYASTIAQLIDRIQADKALLESEQTVQTFVEKQKELHEIGLQLSSLENPDELYREAIQLGHDILDYDRLGLYLLDSERKVVHGTFGIGVDGKLRNENDEVHTLADEPRMQTFLYDNERLVVNEDADLHEDGKVVGHGWNLTATLWGRNKPIGLLFADNLINQQPLQPHQPELLTTFSATIANLIERQQAATEREQMLHNAEQQTVHLTYLNKMSTALNQAESVDDVYRLIGDYTLKIVNGERASLALITDDKETVELFGLSGIKGAVPLGTKLPINSTGIGLALQENRQICFPEEASMDTFFDTQKMLDQGLQAAIVTPLVVEDQLIGSLNLASKTIFENLEQNKTLLQQVAGLVSSALQIKQVQERTQAILESIGTPLVIVRVADATVVYGNEPLAELFGMNSDEMIGQTTPDFFHDPKDKDVYIGLLRESGRLTNHEVLLKHADGTPFWALLNGKITHFQGELVTITSFVDITERQEAIAAVQANEALMHTIIDSTPDWIFIKDPEHRYQMVNQAYANSMNLSPEDFLGKNDIEIGFPEEIVKGNPGKGIRGFWADDQEIMEAGEIKVIDEEPAQIDGKPHILNTIKVPLKDKEGNINGIVGFVSDITNIKEAEKMLAKQAEDLQTVADLSTQITSMQDPQTLMETIVQETQKRFDLYHCHIFLVDESGRNLRIQACGWHPDATEYGTHGDALIALNAKQSLVAQAARTKQAVVINDVANNPHWLPNKLLPDTRAELAVPMIVGDNVIGVLDVQSTTIDRFKPQDVQIQSTLASQIAVALENARSLVRNQQAVDELDALTRRLTRESWEEYLADIEERDTGFVYDLGQLSAVDGTDADVVEGETAVSSTNGHLSQSLIVHGESIGHLTIFDDADTEQLGDDAALIMAAVAEQLSTRVENIRLTEQTQQALAQTQDQAQRLGLLNEISAEMSNVDTLNQVFNIIFARIPDLLKVDRVSLTMLQPDQETLEIIGYQGEKMDAPTGTLIPLSGTIMEQAITENRVLSHDTVDSDSAIRSSMVAPLSSAGRSIGTLNIGGKKSGALTDKDRTLMQQLATMLSSVIENKQLLAAAQARAERERQVRTITDKIRRGVDREAILTIAQQEISTLIGAKQSAAQLGTKTQLLERIQQTLAQSQQSSD